MISAIAASMAAIAVALGAAALTASAQERYPGKPVKVLLPLPPGGGLDTVTRIITERVAAAFGQPVLVENRPGANGMIAAGVAAKAPADGDTLLFSHSAIVLNPGLQPDAPYKLTEFEPLTLIASIPIAFAINGAVPAASLREFVELARARPKQYAFGSYGTGSAAHVLGEMLNSAAKIDLVHVPYKGEAPLIPDLLAGQIHSGWGSPGSMAQHAKTGKLKLLAVSGTRRATSLPEVPTFPEAGFPTINLAGWFGAFAPAGAPRPVAERIAAEIVKAARTAEVGGKITDLGYDVAVSGAGEFAQMVRGEAERWAALIREFRIQAN